MLLCIAAAAQLGCASEGLEPLHSGERATGREVPAEAEEEPQGASEVGARGEAALARLAALAVVDVGHISDPNPEEGPHCYNLPCTDEELASQVGRLEALTDVVAAAVEAGPISLAESTTAAASDGNCAPLNADIESSLAALRALNVVTEAGLSGGDASHCYCFSGGDPCVDAVAEKAGVVARVVADLDAVPPSPFASAR